MKTLNNEFLQSFIDAISEDERVFTSISKNDDVFCEKISYEFKEIGRIPSGEDIFSFHYICSLDELILNKLKNNSSLRMDEFETRLSINYYNLLKTFCYKKYEVDLDTIPWVLESLKYIDNKCELLNHSKFLTNQYADNAVLQSTSNLIGIDNRIKSVDNVLNDFVEDTENKIDSISVQIKAQNDTYKKQNKKIKKQEQKSIENNITILGIFVGIVAVLFGGISFVSLLSDKLLSANPIKSFMLITFMAIILFDSILALFYYISKVTDKNLISSNDCWTQCKYMNNKNDKYSKLKKPIYFVRRTVCTIAQKSKFAFWSNVVLVEFLLFLFILYLLINNGRFNGDTENGITFLNVFFAILLPAISSFTIAILARPCKCYYEYANKTLQKTNK